MDSQQLAELERRLWGASDELRANSNLSSAAYSPPVLGLIFLRYADIRFTRAEAKLSGKGSGRRKIGPRDYQALGVMYLPEEARFSRLRELPEGANLGKALNDAMKAIEEHNDDLAGALPMMYTSLTNDVLIELIRLMGMIHDDIKGDALGRIYEYFLANFAKEEGRRGGEFFTPTSIVKLIVDIIEPFHGRILDPACGSGGMFVQSARFVESHQKDPSREISIYGQEKVSDTIKLCRMNLAVHGLSGDIKEAITYYEDAHDSVGTFDFVMANPPFNVDEVKKERIRDDPRYPLGIPQADNANYLWIQIFASALNKQGRAGFVMANSASDIGHSEREIRRRLIESGLVDIVIAISPKFFYTVGLPVTLWFLDRGKDKTTRSDSILFIDARHVYHVIDRAHRNFTPEQHEFLANIARLYRGEEPQFLSGSDAMTKERFPELTYQDVAGLCKVATTEDIEDQGWSLNPGRYVGVSPGVDEPVDLSQRFGELNEELTALSREASDLTDTVLNQAAELMNSREANEQD